MIRGGYTPGMNVAAMVVIEWPSGMDGNCMQLMNSTKAKVTGGASGVIFRRTSVDGSLKLAP